MKPSVNMNNVGVVILRNGTVGWLKMVPVVERISEEYAAEAAFIEQAKACLDSTRIT